MALQDRLSRMEVWRRAGAQKVAIAVEGQQLESRILLLERTHERPASRSDDGLVLAERMNGRMRLFRVGPRARTIWLRIEHQALAMPFSSRSRHERGMLQHDSPIIVVVPVHGRSGVHRDEVAVELFPLDVAEDYQL
jgi:hypothetical protein